jgi:hypothetical protein
MKLLYTRHLPSGEVLHEIVEAPTERMAIRIARERARQQAEDGRGGTVQLMNGAGRFLIERQAIEAFAPKSPRPGESS